MKTGELLAGILISVTVFIFFFILSIPYFSGDVKNHIVWGESILNQGPSGFYGREFKDYSFPNYPPLSMLSFAASARLYDFTKSSSQSLNRYSLFPSFLIPWIEYENVEISFLKIPAILPFVLSGWLIFFFGRLFKINSKRSLIYTLIFLFNPGLFYLAVVWGQNDFTQIFFILAAFYFLLKGNLYLSFTLAGLSILSKQTVLMLWGLFLITVSKLQGLSKSIMALIVSAVILWLAYLPFNNTSVIWPFTFYNETLSVSTGFLVSDNAINIWGVYSNFKQVDAGEKLVFLSYEYWGFLIFGLLLIPLFYRYLKSRFSNELLIQFLFLTSITYFFVLTRMHERYLFSGVIFAQLLTMVKHKYWYNLLFFSLFYFLNLYRGLYQPGIDGLSVLVKNEIFLDILAGIYLLLLAYNYYLFMFKLKYEQD